MAGKTCQMATCKERKVKVKEVRRRLKEQYDADTERLANIYNICETNPRLYFTRPGRAIEFMGPLFQNKLRRGKHVKHHVVKT
jgi:hypothetical protein